MKKQVVLKALPNDKVSAYNYRGYGGWETGIVYETETNWREDGTYSNSYRVCLDRRSSKGNYIIIYVGDNRIDKF